MGITKRMETRRNFNHFFTRHQDKRNIAFTQGKKFLEGALPVGQQPAWASVIPHICRSSFQTPTQSRIQDGSFFCHGERGSKGQRRDRGLASTNSPLYSVPR